MLSYLSKPLDALGLALFAVSGCGKALILGPHSLPEVLLSLVTTVGGGAVRDLLVAETPRALREEIYAPAAMVGATILMAGAVLGPPDS